MYVLATRRAVEFSQRLFDKACSVSPFLPLLSGTDPEADSGPAVSRTKRTPSGFTFP